MEAVATIVPLGRIELAADVLLPERPKGLVLFAHGSGSSRLSPRNIRVAEVLNRSAIGTVLIDLLTEQENALDIQTAWLHLDTVRLASRVAVITDWVGRQPDLKNLGLGYFGGSTGAAAALVAAADRPNIVRAVVVRGGRPDLAGPALNRVLAPTLFIVGENDPDVMELNYAAASHLPTEIEHMIVVVPGATHLFQEPGALDRVAALACDWFREHLKPQPPRP